MGTIIDRICEVGALTEEAEMLFEGGQKPDALGKRIGAALRLLYFAEVGYGHQDGGRRYTNPQGTIFMRDVATSVVTGKGDQRAISRVPQIIAKLEGVEKELLSSMKKLGLTKKHSLSDQVGLSEPGGHPRVWYHWIDNGWFYVDVDYTIDY